MNGVGSYNSIHQKLSTISKTNASAHFRFRIFNNGIIKSSLRVITNDPTEFIGNLERTLIHRLSNFNF